MQERMRAGQGVEGQGAGLGSELEGAAAVVALGGIPEQYASKSATWKRGYEDGLSQGRAGMHRIEEDPKTSGAINKASTATGVAEDHLTAMSIIESTGNRNVGTNAFGYTGLMQMGSEAASDLGMSYKKMKGGENVDYNALAGAKYWKLNEGRLNEGIPRDPLHMYLAHQQGAGGTNALMETLQTNPGAMATRNQRNNIPDDLRMDLKGKATQQDFYDYWAGKMQAIQDVIAEKKGPAQS
jgi:hypothetical protein